MKLTTLYVLFVVICAFFSVAIAPATPAYAATAQSNVSTPGHYCGKVTNLVELQTGIKKISCIYDTPLRWVLLTRCTGRGSAALTVLTAQWVNQQYGYQFVPLFSKQIKCDGGWKIGQYGFNGRIAFISTRNIDTIVFAE